MNFFHHPKDSKYIKKWFILVGKIHTLKPKENNIEKRVSITTKNNKSENKIRRLKLIMKWNFEIEITKINKVLANLTKIYGEKKIIKTLKGDTVTDAESLFSKKNF